MASSPAAAPTNQQRPAPPPARLVDALSTTAPTTATGEDLPSLIEVLAGVPDPRRARGVRHELLVVLVLACCAVLARHASYVAIAEWTRDSGPAVLNALGWNDAGSRRPLPCESTIRRLLNSLDAPALEAALCSWTARRLADRRRLDPTRRRLPRAEQTRVIALDGKTRRGSPARGTPEADAIAAAGGGRVHLVAALDVEAGVVLGQGACDMAGRGGGKGGEIATAAGVLADLHERGLLAGAVVTMDALHTQRSHADYLHTAGADWIFTVKGNQPTLQARLKALNWADVPVGDRIRDVGHGRRETRTIYVMSIENIPDRDRFGVVEFFPHAAQAIKLIRRVRRRDGRWHTETVYAITSLDYRDAHPALVAAWIRGHWRIENSLHWVRDVTFGEDASQVRVGSGPQVLSALTNLAISALRLVGAVNVAAELRRHGRDPLRTLATFGLT